MKIEKGTSRVALIGELFTVKVAYPQIRAAKSRLHFMKKTRDGLREVLRESVDAPGSLAYCLLRGVAENRREAAISRRGVEVIVPTRLSIFGLINIQDSALPISIPSEEIFKAFLSELQAQDILTREVKNEIIEGGGHTLPNSKNYGVHKGRIKLLDYGEKGLNALLRKYGHILEKVLKEKMAETQAH